MFKQLSDQAAGYLYLETAETPQHVGGMSLVDLPADFDGDFYAAYKAHIGRRLHLIPMLHQKLVQLPLELDHPFWADDDHVDLDYHIRRHTLPRPGRMGQLEELVGRLHSHFLDRSRPLWEFYVIDGLESGQVAIYTKIHHCAMDGASSRLLVETMYDPTPVPRQLPPPPEKTAAAAAPDLPALVRGVADHLVRQEIRALQYLPDLLKTWTHLVLPDATTLKYGRAILPPLRPPKTLFNVAITSQRTYAARTLPLSAFKRVAKVAGAKVNDVVLAVCSAALRRYLLGKGALPKSSLTAMVPVALHAPGDTAPANENTSILCTLATDVDDAWQRLLRVRESTAEQKQMLGTIRDALIPDLGLGSGALVRSMVDLSRRAGLAGELPPLFNLVVSNVPGPPVPLYIVGARLASFHPCSIPFHGTALNITVESYCDALDFGLVACRRTVPDLGELADHLGDALAELAAAAEAQRPPADATTRAVAASAAAAPSKKPAPAAPKPPAGPPPAPAPAPAPTASKRRRTAAPRRGATALPVAAPAAAANVSTTPARTRSRRPRATAVSSAGDDKA